MSIMALAAIVFTFTACSSSDDEPVKEPTLMDLDLSKVSSIVGEWKTDSSLSDYTGDFEYMGADAEIWNIKADGTMIRKVSAYSFSGTYTYDNGTLVYKEANDVWTYKFSHYNEYRLKVVVTLKGVESLPSTYLIMPYGN